MSARAWSPGIRSGSWARLALAGCLALIAGPIAAPAAPAPPRQEAPGFPALEALEREIGRLIETARPSVVGVVARSPLERLLDSLGGDVRFDHVQIEPGGPLARRVGSGIVFDTSGHVVTLASVVSGATEVIVLSSDGRRHTATIAGLDDYSGLAVLKARDGGAGFKPLVFADPDAVRVGTLVTTLASPAGEAGGAPVYAVGFVSGVGVSPGPVRRGSYIKLSAPAAPGAGGGAVLDARGRLVGIIFGADVPLPAPLRAGHGPIRWEERTPEGDDLKMRLRVEVPEPPDPHDLPEGDDEPVIAPEISMRLLEALHRSGGAGAGLSYAVPAGVVRHVAEEILRTGSVRRGWVGVKIEEAEPGEVRLLSVVPGSPAEKAGLRPEDRIVTFSLGSAALEPLTASSLLVDRIASSSPGTPMRLGLLRDGRRLDVALVLAESPGPPRPRRIETALAPRVAMPRRPTLGVEVGQDLDEADRERLGAPEGLGLLVRSVRAASRAAQAGMKEGDLIIEALGIPMRTLVDLRAALHRQGNREMTLKVIRDRREISLDVPPPPPSPPAPEPPAPPAPAPRPRRQPG